MFARRVPLARQVLAFPFEVDPINGPRPSLGAGQRLLVLTLVQQNWTLGCMSAVFAHRIPLQLGRLSSDRSGPKGMAALSLFDVFAILCVNGYGRLTLGRKLIP